MTCSILNGCFTDISGRHNVEYNARDLEAQHGPSGLRVFPLDWSTVPSPQEISDKEKYPVILAADSIYEAEHSPWLANAVVGYLAKAADARVLVELPCRKGYEDEREDLMQCLDDRGLVKIAEGVHWGWDEFGDQSEKREHRWGVWKWKELNT